MPIKRRAQTVVDKEGLRFIQSVIEGANCIFHEIHRENDYGLDGILEFVENEIVLGSSIGVQLKSGKSYCSPTTCRIPATAGHFAYWDKHSLPVIGIVYDPTEKCAYWTNITNWLKADLGRIRNGPFVIEFDKSDIYKFNKEYFTKVFLPLFLRKPLPLSYDEASTWAVDSDYQKHCLGVGTLLYLYRNRRQAWDLFVELFRKREIGDLDSYLIYILALVNGHPDISWHKNNTLDPDVAEYAKAKIKAFDVNDLEKLLLFVDENSFSRGSVGQNVHSIFDLIDQNEQKLFTLLETRELSDECADTALLLYAYVHQKRSVPQLEIFLAGKFKDRSVIKMILGDFRRQGVISFY